MTSHASSPDGAFVPHGNSVPPDNFVQCLRSLAASQPGQVALVVVAQQGDELVETTLTYGAFEQQVRALAAALQRRFGTGDRLLVLLDNDQHYAISMFACFYAGLIAVPVFPPESTRPQHLARLTMIAADARATGMLTIGALRDLVGGVAAGFGMPVPIAVDEIDRSAATDWLPHDPAPDDVAFLQYTSGSTSAPKGVMVSHGHLMANERAIRQVMGIGADDKLGVWSPLFHDMGLIGGLLQPFYSGIPCVLCSPRFFLERPVRWLELISRHGVTVSGGPDFAYRLCLERVGDAQLGGLDLSSWRVAYTGAEPVRHDTMDAFVARYASVGFSAGAVYPCYGLAEATLLVSGGHRGGGMVTRRFDATALSRRLAVPDGAGVALVGCGTAPCGHEIRFVDPQREAMVEKGAIGEIWVAGPSVAGGYWNKPRETAEAFVERDGRRWLRTGDLGFEHDGELFVAGRIKDMIVVRGHNLYPQDIERAVEAEIDAVRKGRVAAFAVNLAGEEGVGLAVEVSRGLQKLIAPQVLFDALSAAVSECCGEAPAVVLLLNAGALPKTSSGKLQRGACRQGWSDKSLDAYAVFERGQLADDGVAAGVAAPRCDDVAAALAQIWREVLQHDAAGHDAERIYADDAHFLALGGNSLAAVQLASQVARRWQIEFPPRRVFEYPRLRDQADAIRRGVRTEGQGAAALVPVLPAARRGEPSPLSPAQRRQWFLWRLDPQGSAYHVQGALRMTGALDVSAMRDAVANLVRRHEVLCTVFRVVADADVEQVVDPAAALDVQQIDLSDRCEADAEATTAETLRALSARPFDLTRGPLVRAVLIRLTPRVHVLALVMHHIVSDGASMQVLVDELGALYAARRAGEAGSDLTPPTIQYADYVLWQRDQVDEAAHLCQLAYWRKQLEVAPGESQPVLALTSDGARRPVTPYRASQYRFELPTAVVQGLRRQAQARDTTLFTVLLAGFQSLLYRYTGLRDIRVGVPVANRGSAELQGVVGLFVNTLVLRARLHGRLRLAQVLAQVREAVLGAQANQTLPFERLVEALQPERSLNHSPLFQVMFNHLREDYSVFARQTGLAAEPQWLPDAEAQFELTLDTREHADGRVSAQLTYASELFEAARVERLAHHYVAVLRELVEHPERALGDVALLDGDELQQLEACGVNPQRFPDTEPVHHLIERQAARRPAAIALVLGDKALSYAELDARANRLAHRLLALGVTPEQRVGLALERSIDMVVALLAVLKAGGVFVALDPGYPSERLAAMVDDSQIRLVLAQRHIAERLDLGAAPTVVVVETLDLDRGAAHAPPVRLHPESLAYVIYTSGSTGRPKGVAVAQRALVEHAQLSAAFSSLTPQDRMLQFSTLNFDGFIEQLFPPLLVGAAVVLRGPELWSPEELLHEMRAHRITIVDLPTAYWLALIQFLAAAGRRDHGNLREVHIGGEAMPVEAIPVWKAAGLDHVTLLNTYGPTEAVVVASLADCAPYVAGERALPVRMPIGRPLPGRSLRVLDADLQPLPVGVAGELYIGGALLARGYLGRAGLTAQRFVADPFAASGGRLYRTGDCVRWNGEGHLEYLGRIDHQVKIRGFRVEPGEIEAQLLAQPEVGAAVVVARDARIVAYVAPRTGQVVDASALRNRLTQTLPDYMVPGAVMVLASLPLNPNGKVDRHALPPPEFVGSAPYERPQGEVEEELAAIWAEVLGVARVGRRDSFFDLGGHSLLLLKLHQRLAERRLAITPAVVDLFRYPTIESLAAFVRAGAAVEGDEQRRIAERAARQRQALVPRRSRMARADT